MSGRAADEHRILDTAGDDAAGERRACGERTTDQTPRLPVMVARKGSAPCAWSRGNEKTVSVQLVGPVLTSVVLGQQGDGRAACVVV